MAIQIKNTYSGRTDNTDSNYPYGKGRNVVGGVEGTGTPFEADWYNNLEGFLQGLLLEAGITPNGNVDNANSSQLVEAVKGLVKDLDTFEDLKAVSHLSIGDTIKTKGYYIAGDGGGGEYVIDDGPSDDLGNPQIANGLTARLQATNGEVSLLQYGAKSGINVAQLNGEDQAWELKTPITYNVGDIIRVKSNMPSASFDTLLGAIANKFLIRRSSNGTIIFNGCSIKVNGIIALSGSTQWPSDESEFEITIDQNNCILPVIGVRGDGGGGYFEGYIYDFKDSLGNEILLTNKGQGVVQTATAGAIDATMTNYSSDVWKTNPSVTNDSIYSIFTHSQPDHTIVFNSGKTFLVGGVVRIDNNSDKTGVTRSYRVKAYGSKILKKDFTGSSFLRIEHNPNDEWYINRYELDEWDLTWEGGEQDANGFNQNFRMAANLRDGLGDLDLNYYTTPEQQAKALEYQALQAEVFGNPELTWYINPLSTSVPHTNPNDGSYEDGSWLDVIGGRNVTFKDIVTKRRHEEGLVGRGCRTLTFENCHDYDALPTNDQFQIYITGGGNFTNGQQHFHMRSTNGQTLIRLVVSDASQLSEGQKVTDTGSEQDDEKTEGIIHKIEGNQLFLKHVYYGEGFTTGTELKVNGTVMNGVYILSFNIIEAPTMIVDSCSSSVGNSGIGYMNIENCPTFSTLTVSNYVGRDLGLIGIRVEHVHTLQLSNISLISSNILSDPTGTLDYWTMAGIEVGASTRQVTTDNIILINSSITGNIDSRQDSQILTGIQVKYTEGKGRVNATTLKPSTTTAIQGLIGSVADIKISAYKYTNFENQYPLDPAIKVHRGRVSDFEIDGCQRGIAQCEQISDGSIKNCEARAIDEIWTEGGKVTAVIDNVTAKNVGEFARIPGGDYSTGNDSLLKVSSCTIENVKGLVFVSTNVETVLELRGNSFRNWGIDDTLDDDLRWLIGNNSSGGAQAREVYLLGNSFRSDSVFSTKKLWTMNVGTNDTLVEKGSIYANSLPESWEVYRGNDGVYVRDNYVTDLIKTKDGIEVFNSTGKTVGVCRFNTSRMAYRFNEPSVSNFPLYADDGSPYLNCNSGDVLSMVCRLTSTKTGTLQALLGGTDAGVYITTDNLIRWYGADITLEIDGVVYEEQASIAHLMDTNEHTVKIIFNSEFELRYIGSSSSGTSDHTTFGIYNISYTSSINDNRFYAFDEGEGSLIHDSISSHDVTLNYGYAGEWYSAWLD